jgi:hypothetical protein
VSDSYGVRDAACPLSTRGGGGGLPSQRGRALLVDCAFSLLALVASFYQRKGLAGP